MVKTLKIKGLLRRSNEIWHKKIEYIVVAIEVLKNLSIISMEFLLGLLQSHELCMKQYDFFPLSKHFKLNYLLEDILDGEEEEVLITKNEWAI